MAPKKEGGLRAALSSDFGGPSVFLKGIVWHGEGRGFSHLECRVGTSPPTGGAAWTVPSYGVGSREDQRFLIHTKES